MEIRATEEIARQTIDGLVDDVLGYINPANDNALAPWMMALERGKEIVLALQTVCDAIAARPTMNPGQMALRAIADIDVCNPEGDAAFEQLARETAQIREAQKIDAAHPVTFDMASFAAKSLGIGA
jgi:hypothetical protein